MSLGNLLTCGLLSQSETFYRLDSVSGVIEPGQMTLVIAPPGHGKSSYLRALSGRLKLPSEKHVLFNGRTRSQAAKEGCDVQKMVTYVDQIDDHIPVLTVDETLEFTHQMSSSQFSRERIDKVIEAFHMEECRSTIVGDHSVRGISGGQKRRVSVMEACLSDACVLFLDEFTNGLDSAVAERLCKYFQTWCRDNNTSVVATLQQPTPLAFECFDRVVVLREGRVVYDGPREDTLAYFEGMGFKCPDDVDTCDFVIDCISQPVICYQNLKRAELISLQEQQQQHASSPPVSTSSSPHPGAIPITLGNLHVSPVPCIRTCDMVEYFDSTPFSLAIRKKLSMVFESSLDEDDDTIGGNHQHVEGSPQNAMAGASVPSPVSLQNQRQEQQQQLKVSPIEQPPLVTDATRDMYRMGYRLSTFQTLTYVIMRQLKLQFRNLSVFIPRLILAAVISFNFGGIYFNVSSSDYVLRLSSFSESSTEMAYNNLVELGLFMDSRQIIQKQLHMYPTYIYVIAALIVSIPFILAEVMVFGLILFFMIHHHRHFVTFLLNYLVLFMQSLAMVTWFRFGAACARDIGMAYTLVNPITLFSILANGFYSTPEQLPPFMIWLYWISPFSWGLRSLSQVEFLSSRYDNLVDDPSNVGQLIRVGDAYLKQQSIPVGYQWVVYGVLYHIACVIIFSTLTSWLLDQPYIERSVGTKRFNDDESMILDDPLAQIDGISPAALITDNTQQPDQNNHQPQPTDDDDVIHERRVVPAEDNSDREMSTNSNSVSYSSSFGSQSQSGTQFGGPQLKLTTLTEELNFTPATLLFHNLTYIVPVKDENGQPSQRTLLNNISGVSRPGKLIALMGASGAGKTTLLDVLANRKTMGQLSGTILVNGKKLTPHQFARVSGYVEQFDSLFAYSTVRETLLFAARMRLPADVSDKTKNNVVDEILDILDLRSIESMMLGDSSDPILSPSQLKRVSIGVELVANPSILFLDEPTTGLDSKSAQTVMRAVRRIARSGRSVICTIHQPSAELFFLFDQLVLLGPGGFQLFFGDIGFRGRRLIRYFSRIPGVGGMPLRSNPASWVVDIVAQTLRGKDEDARIDETNSESLVKMARESFIAYYTDQNSINLLSNDAHGQPEMLGDHFNSLREGQKTVRFYNIYYWNHQIYRSLLEDLHGDMKSSGAVRDIRPGNGQVSHAHGDGNNNNDSIEMAHMDHQNDPDQHSLHDVNAEESVLLTNTAGDLFVQSQPYTTQWILLFQRNWMSFWRNTPLFWSRLWFIIISLCYGLLYFQVEASNQAEAIALTTSIIMPTMNMSIVAATTLVPFFHSLRPIFYRERFSGFYAPLLWNLSFILMEIIACIPIAMLTILIHYFLIGLSSDAGIFFRFYFTNYVANILYACFGMMTSSLFDRYSIVEIIQNFYLTLAMSSTGIGMTLKTMRNSFFLFLFRVLPVSHCAEAWLMPEFATRSESIAVLTDNGEVVMPIREWAIEYFGYEYGHYWTHIGWLALMGLVFGIIGCIASVFLIHSKR